MLDHAIMLLDLIKEQKGNSPCSWTRGATQSANHMSTSFDLLYISSWMLPVLCMRRVLEIRVQINHPRGKGKRTQNKVQFEMLLDRRKYMG